MGAYPRRYAPGLNFIFVGGFLEDDGYGGGQLLGQTLVVLFPRCLEIE